MKGDLKINNEKLNELYTNEAFGEALSKATTIEEARKLFSEYGLDLTLDEVKSLIKPKEGELADDDLDKVSGGLSFRKIDVLIRK